MSQDNLEEKLKPLRDENVTVEAIVDAAGFIASNEQDTAERALSSVLNALDHFGADEEKFKSILKAIDERYADNKTIREFTVNAQKAHDEIMKKVYEKIINPRSGTPCCPKCGSASIG